MMLWLFDADAWRETFESLSRHKLRSALTAFGIFWGIFMLVNLLGMAKGLENGFESGFGGNNKVIYFWSARPATLPYQGLPLGRKLQFKEADIAAIMSRFSQVKYVAPFNGYGEQLALRGHKSEVFQLNGGVGAMLKLRGYRVTHGRFLNDFDSNQSRNVVVIGSQVYSAMFEPGENPVGKYIQVLGTPLKVVGVFEPTGTSEWQQRDRRIIFLPRKTLTRLTNMADSVHWFTVVLQDDVEAKLLEQGIAALLRERHQFHPEDLGVVGSYNNQENYDKWRRVLLAIQGFSWFVAVGTILAGAVGVGNIMLITVKERTKEIGLRKALGATPSAIVFSVVKESMVLSFIAGYMGLVAGVLTVETVAAVVAQGAPNNRFSNPEVSFTTALIAMVVLLLASAFAAYIPAKKAATIHPVSALQNE